MTKQDKVEKVMGEWKAGTLTSHGKKVTNYDQAVAIALSEAGLSKKMKEGGGIGFVPMDLEEELMITAKWGGTNIKGVIGILNAMIDSGLTDDDLKVKPIKNTRFQIERATEKKIQEIWNKIEPNYKGDFKGNMYYSTIKRLVNRSGTDDNILKKYKPFRKYQYAEGGGIEKENALMVANNNKQIEHHTKEMEEALKDTDYVPAWVVAKVNRSASDLSDATHYLEGQEGKYEKGGNMNKYAKGGSIDTPKIYVADLEAYNNGKLVGEWLDLSDFEDGEEVSKEISKLLKKWGAEEYAIHDVENVPSSMYSEYMGEEDFDKIIKIYKASEENDLPYEVISEIMLQYEPEDLEEWISDYYEGHFDNDTDLAYNVVESIGSVSDLGNKTTEMYFDYDKFGRDLAINDEWEGDFDSDEDRGYDYVENMGGVSELGERTIDMYFDYEKFGRDLAINDYTEIEDGYYFRTPRYAKGGLTNERRYVNKSQDYELRYAKNRLKRTGYKNERKFAVGGEIGNTVIFSRYGERTTGRVTDKLKNGYEVVTDEGTILVEPQEVISFSDEPIAKKKRFGFFEGGGEVDGVSFSRLKSNFKNNLEIFNGEVVTIGDNKFKIEGNKFYIKKPNEDWVIFRIIKGEMFAGGGEIENKIEKLKKVVSSKMLPESVKAKAQAEIDKLEKELQGSKETKAEEKAEHEAKLDEKEELNATIQKLYDIEAKAEDLINYQSGGIQGQSVDKIKKYVEYVNKEVSKLNVPFGSEVYDVLEDENAHSLNLTLGLLGFYKNERDSGEWAKKYEQYAKVIEVVNEVKGGGKSEAKKPTTIKFGNITFTIDSAELENGGNVYGGHIDIYNRVIKGFPYNYKTAKEVEERMKSYIKGIKSATYHGSKGRESQKLPYLVIFNDGQAEIKEKFETAKEALNFHKVLDSIVNSNTPSKPTTRKGKVSPEDIRHKLKEGYSYSWTSAEIGEPNKIELFGFTIYDENGKDVFKSSMIYDDLKQVKLAVNNRLSKIIPTPSKPTTRKAPVKKAVAKKTVAKKAEVKAKFKVDDIVGTDKDDTLAKKITSFKTNRKGEVIYSGYYISKPSEKFSFEESELVSIKAPAKPKADHKKLVAKLKAKKGGKEYDNRASLVPFTDKRRERSESSDKKRSALPPGKRVSENGVTYYENRLNRTDLSKKDKFEDGGELKSSDWSLNLNW